MEKVFTNIEWVKWLREQARLKRPYWYGTCHYECTESLLAKKAKQYPTHYGKSRFARYSADIKASQICGDCVGAAIKGAVWSELGTRTSKNGSNGCPDKSADGMFGYCKSVGMDWGGIDSIPDEPGIAVRYSGHVGVYVGGGEVVEWRGFAYGCVITKLKDRKWTHWYKVPWCEYVAPARPEAPEESAEIIDVGALGSRLLKSGRKGEDVRTLQEMLIGLGYDLSQHGADGDYGGETENAVMDFQRDQGLDADGDYGPMTHAALMEILAERSAQENEDGGDETQAPAGSKRYVLVTGGSVYIRKGPGKEHDVITVVREGMLLDWVATAANGWHAVELDGVEGWIGPTYSEVVEE